MSRKILRSSIVSRRSYGFVTFVVGAVLVAGLAPWALAAMLAGLR